MIAFAMMVELFPPDRAFSSPNFTDPNAIGVDGESCVIERWTSTGTDVLVFPVVGHCCCCSVRS